MLRWFGSWNSCIVALAMILFFTGTYFWIRELEPKQDVLWLHFIGYEWFQPSKSQQALEGLTLTSSEDKLEVWRRLGMRWAYPVHAISGQIGAVFGGDSRFAAFGIGMALPFLVGMAIFLRAAWAAGEVEPLTLAACVYAMTALLPGPSPSDHLFYYDSALKNAVNLAVLLLNPGGAFNPLSVQPKSTILLFVMAAFALRRAGRPGVGYGLIACGALWHAHLAVVVLGLVAAWDLIVWRKLAERVPQLQPKDEAVAFSALCIAIAAVSAMAYLALRGDQTWGLESALIQLSTRMLLLAEALTLSYASLIAWQWAVVEIGAVALRRIFHTAIWFVAGLAAFAAAGMIWDRSRYIPEELSKANYIEQKFGDVAAYYDIALRRLHKK